VKSNKLRTAITIIIMALGIFAPAVAIVFLDASGFGDGLCTQ
jgi:hypothetical protein